MKKFKKLCSKIITLALTLSVLASVAMFGACGVGGNPGGASTVRISVADMGWGTKWLNDLKREYEAQRLGYVSITPSSGGSGNSAIISAVEGKTSSIDIAFVESGIAGKVYESGGDAYFADLTELVSEPYADEGGATILSKMQATTKELLRFEVGGQDKYYSLPWAGGISGIVMNGDVWDAWVARNDIDAKYKQLPVTTDELIALSSEFATKNANAFPEVTPWIYSNKSEYYSMFFPIWFAQYEGAAGMQNFLAGKNSEGIIDEEIYGYQGQLEALEVMNDIINGTKFQHSGSIDLDFTDIQGQFVNNNAALFMINGAWLENEANASDSNINFFRTPVVSAVRNRTTTVETDAELSALIKAIDSGSTALVGTGYDVNQTDYNVIKDARSISYLASGSSAVALVPVNSPRQDEAKDFLRFMYSDQGLKIIYSALKGARIPVRTSDNQYPATALSDFVQTIIQAEDNNLVFNYSSKAKTFTLAGVDMVFRNGTGNDTAISLLKKGTTPMQIIDMNIDDLLVKKQNNQFIFN